MEWQVLIFANYVQKGQPENVREVAKVCVCD